MIITKKTRSHATVTTILYMLCLIWVVALKCNMHAAVTDSIIYNRTMGLFERAAMYMSYFAKTTPQDAIVNIIIFVPVGLLLPFFFEERPCLKALLIGFMMTWAFELFQIVSCIGGFTYIDIINNTVGTAIGCIAHAILRERVDGKVARVALDVTGVMALGILVFAIYNTVKNIHIYFI